MGNPTKFDDAIAKIKTLSPDGGETLKIIAETSANDVESAKADLAKSKQRVMGIPQMDQYMGYNKGLATKALASGDIGAAVEAEKTMLSIQLAYDALIKTNTGGPGGQALAEGVLKTFAGDKAVDELRALNKANTQLTNDSRVGGALYKIVGDQAEQKKHADGLGAELKTAADFVVLTGGEMVGAPPKTPPVDSTKGADKGPVKQ
jgi:hypothetical protein